MPIASARACASCSAQIWKMASWSYLVAARARCARRRARSCGDIGLRSSGLGWLAALVRRPDSPSTGSRPTPSTATCRTRPTARSTASCSPRRCSLPCCSSGGASPRRLPVCSARDPGCVRSGIDAASGWRGALDEDAVEPYVTFLAEGGVDGDLRLGTTGEGILLSARPSGGGSLELFVAAAAREACRRGALRRADDGRDRGARRSRGRGRRRRGGGDRAAVLPARRRGARGALRRRGGRVRAARRSTSTSSRRGADTRCPSR